MLSLRAQKPVPTARASFASASSRAEAGSYGTSLFRECFVEGGRPPLYELAYTASELREPPTRGRDLLGGFADLRRLLAVEGP